MIQPEEIRQKAEKLYSAYLRAWLADEEFFPRVVPCDRKLDDNLAAAASAVQLLRSGSKEDIGYGYSIDWEERNSRRHGRNKFPRQIYFQSASDLLRLIGKQREFSAFTAAVQRIRARHPNLDPWVRTNRQLVIDSAGAIDGLLEVVDYFCMHPRPNLFTRELPLSVDTKFIERNQSLLRAWLDILLPASTIAANEEHFARRFGLKYVEPHVLIRFLDPDSQQTAGVPWSNCCVPLHELAQAEMPATNVIVVENKMNLLTLPPLADTIAIGGMGYGVTDLRYVPWLGRRRLWYWGDIDADGFSILSRFRTAFPHVQSFLMDDTCLARWVDSIGTQSGSRPGESLSNLTTPELLAYCRCISDKCRIEQERIPQSCLVSAISAVFSGRQESEGIPTSGDVTT